MNSVFFRRMAARYEELKTLYCGLYHNDMAAFDYFCGILERSYIMLILSYFLFKWVENKKTATVSALIEKKYDELYAVCEKAHTLLD